jgi:hypothetical protein
MTIIAGGTTNGTTDYFTVEVPRPRLAGNYFDGAQAIDVHNHSRQGQGLGLELRPTNRWQIRFWQTFIGITQVDAHNAYKFLKDDSMTRPRSSSPWRTRS